MANSEIDRLTEENSLEAAADTVVGSSLPESSPQPSSSSHSNNQRILTGRRLAFIAVVIIIIMIISVVVALLTHKKPEKPPATVVINTQSLDNGTLNKLSQDLSKGGKVTQQLTISPSTLFKSDVSVQGNVSIEKNLQVKGSSSLLGPVATGSDLTVGGGVTIARNTAIGGSLSVSGTITAGSISVASLNLSTLSLSGDLSYAGHLITIGPTPTINAGVAIGNGSAKVTGTDSAGTVVITSGSGGLLANGEMAIVKFNKRYTGNPLVQLTPTNQGAAATPYYVTASVGGFSIWTTAPPSPITNYNFNFFITQY